MTAWLVWRSCPGPVWLCPLVVGRMHTLQYRYSACLRKSAHTYENLAEAWLVPGRCA
jgi:hypothetical protein